MPVAVQVRHAHRPVRLLACTSYGELSRLLLCHACMRQTSRCIYLLTACAYVILMVSLLVRRNKWMQSPAEPARPSEHCTKRRATKPSSCSKSSTCSRRTLSCSTSASSPAALRCMDLRRYSSKSDLRPERWLLSTSFISMPQLLLLLPSALLYQRELLFPKYVCTNGSSTMVMRSEATARTANKAERQPKY